MVNSPRGGSLEAPASPRTACASSGEDSSPLTPAAPSAAAPRMKPRLQISHMSSPREENRRAADGELSDGFAFASSVEATLYQMAALANPCRSVQAKVSDRVASACFPLSAVSHTPSRPRVSSGECPLMTRDELWQPNCCSAQGPPIQGYGKMCSRPWGPASEIASFCQLRAIEFQFVGEVVR